MDGYQSKDRSKRANGRDVTFTDGRKIFMGSSGTGAPRDGRDPTEPPTPGLDPLMQVGARRGHPARREHRSNARSEWLRGADIRHG